MSGGAEPTGPTSADPLFAKVLPAGSPAKKRIADVAPAGSAGLEGTSHLCAVLKG